MPPILITPPPLLLILGTDLAGKDHFANVVIDAAESTGIKVERRRGALSGRPDRLRTSEGKGGVLLLIERLFLATLPLHAPLLPFVAACLILLDLRRFRRSPDRCVVVVSHTGLRLLAVGLGHRFDRIEAIRLPAMVDRVLRAIVPTTGARVMVLDIAHRVREARMAKRVKRGTVDHFDRYMAKHPMRSERIESFLVWLGETYLGALCIENNDLSDDALLALLAAGSTKGTPSGEP